ncbi:MAG: hypothetical protein WC708_06000 [Lentisphaeria bacterium]
MSIPRMRSVETTVIVTAIVLVALSVLFVGAAEVTQEWRQRPARQQRLEQTWRAWAQSLACAMPGADQGWKRLASRQPLLLLEASAKPQSE